MNQISDKQIVEYYKTCESYHLTAMCLGVSVDKVLKALSTAGITINETHARVLDLNSKGLIPQQIAEELLLSVASVMRYLPRKRPEYNIKNASDNAIRIRKFRAKTQRDK